MSRNIFFNTNNTFEEYLKSNGFQHRHVDSECKYYVNEKGNQVKLNYEVGIITLLNKNGYVIDYSSTFTKTQIDKFSEGDN